MNKLTKLSLLSVALLATTVACQREAVVEEPASPNFDPTKNEVVADFVFNVSTSTSQTKQNSSAVQASPDDDFRGISDAKLMSYALDDGADPANPTDGIVLAKDADAGKVFDLAAVLAPGALNSDASRRVLEISLPLKSNTLLFYGKAPMGDAYGGFTNVKDCYGFMDSYSISKDKGSADFKIGSRISAQDFTKFQIIENLIAGCQTLLLNHFLPTATAIQANQAPTGTNVPVYGYDIATLPNTIYWADYNSNDGLSPYESGHARYPLEEKLGLVYKELTDIYTASGNELRAGSGEAVIRMAKDLYGVLQEIRYAAPLCPAETVAKYFAEEVYQRMNKYFTPNVDGNGIVTGAAFQAPGTIATNFLSLDEQKYKPGESVPAGFFWPTQGQLETISSYIPLEFPFNFNLPRGSSYQAFDKTTKCFYYPQSFNVSGMGLPGAGATYNAQSYYYPAELMYFGNSPVRISAQPKKVADYPQGSGTADNRWESDGSWSADWTKNSHVTSATRAVAMSYDIQYGTALLATSVAFSSDVQTNGIMYDNNHRVQELKQGRTISNPLEEPDNSITVDGNSFKVTGLIIGGASKAVGWDYLPVKVGDAYQYGFIYDKAIPAVSQAVPTTTPNYTLVLDNFLAASETDGIYTPAAAQQKVYVAIEFQNKTGRDFYGNANLIPVDGYFYLIGCLDPDKPGLASITWPTDHPVPPYNDDGTSQQVKRVFIQDFMTTATFKLGPNSLKSAYLTVPDLRSTSMSLGLSVDLNWETGLNFEDVILG